MFSNISVINSTPVIYPIQDETLPFADYIAQMRSIIENRRIDSTEFGVDKAQIVEANCPYELLPFEPIMSGKRIKHGVLLIHGLLDSPFSMLDIGKRLQRSGVLCRAILLPGQGTQPNDLLKVNYHEWVQAVRYGIESLKQDVEKIHIVGYSTGSALAINHALNDPNVASLVLLSPAIKIKSFVDVLINLHQSLEKSKGKSLNWIYHDKEIDYVKYRSIAFNGVRQVAALTQLIQQSQTHFKNLPPLFMIVSDKDETVSCQSAKDFFSNIDNEANELLIYSSSTKPFADKRITIRPTLYKDLRINHLSHISLPFAPDNPHYGQNGDFQNASKLDAENYMYGAYNPLAERFIRLLHRTGAVKQLRRALTYNPDFDFMADKIITFVLKS